MGHDELTRRRRGLAGSGLGSLKNPGSDRSTGGLRDLIRPLAPRCVRTVDLECHHRITTGGTLINNAQMLCKPCHSATETYGTSSGFSPDPFPEDVKLLARLRCKGQCECEHDHEGHGYALVRPTLSL